MLTFLWRWASYSLTLLRYSLYCPAMPLTAVSKAKDCSCKVSAGWIGHQRAVSGRFTPLEARRVDAPETVGDLFELFDGA